MRVRSLRALQGLTSIVALLGVPVRAEVAPPPAEPSLVVEDQYFEPPRGLARVEVSVSRSTSGQSPENKSTAKPAPAKVWRCVLVARGQAVQNSCSRTTGWMTGGPGLYDVSVSIWRSSGKPVVFAQPLTVTGRERRILTLLRFDVLEACSQESPSHPKGKKPIELDTFTLERVLPPPTELLLRRSWRPLPDGKAVYRIENLGNLTWFGQYSNFSGAVEAFSGGAWKRYHRGYFCTSVERDPPLTEESSTYSSEGYFRGSPIPFAPGRYRYSVMASLDPPEFDRGCAGSPLLRTTNTYELIDEFSIDP